MSNSTFSRKIDPVLFYERVKFLCSNSVYRAERTPSLQLTHGAATRLLQKIRSMNLTSEQVLSMTPTELAASFNEKKEIVNLEKSQYLQPDLALLYSIYLKSREHNSFSTTARKLELTIKVIYQDYYATEDNRTKAEEYGLKLYSETHFRRLWFTYHQSKISPTFRKPTYPGAQSEFDFCGVTLPCGDGTKAQFAVLVLNHSRKCYVEAIPDQSTQSSVNAIVNGFKFFGGVTANLSIDNFKAAVKKAGTYGGELTEAFTMLQQFLGTYIMTMKVRKGNLKGVAESHVKIVTHTLLARMKQMMNDGHGFASLKEMNDWLLKNLYRINSHRVSGMKITREEMFREERKALRPVNNWNFSINEISSFTLPKTSRVIFNTHQYCLPVELTGHKLQMEVKPDMVVFYEGGRCICSYKRRDGVAGISAKKGYVPDRQMYAEVLLAVPDVMLFEWAGAIGPNTLCRVRTLLSGAPNVDRSRRVLKLLGMCREYPAWYKTFDEFLGKNRNINSVSRLASEWKLVSKPDTARKDTLYSFGYLYSMMEKHFDGSEEPLRWTRHDAGQTRQKGRVFMHYKSRTSDTGTSTDDDTDQIGVKAIDQIESAATEQSTSSAAQRSNV